jgi:hypothetical protein
MSLTPSQRVTLITGIADELSKETRFHIRTVLHQFSIRTQSFEIDDDRAFVFAMIDDAPDEALVALGEHFGIFGSNLPEPPVPTFWEHGYLRLFISHMSQQRAFAGNLQLYLAKYGISGFVAHKDIAPTKEWQDEIIAALDSCHALIALMHTDFHSNPWTDQEIGYAMGRRVPVCSVILGTTPYGFIGRYQAFRSDATNEAIPSLAKEIYEAYSVHQATRNVMTEAVLQLFEQAPTFARAKEIKDLLWTQPGLNASHVDRLRRALESNDQLSGSFTVPGAISALAKRLTGQ